MNNYIHLNSADNVVVLLKETPQGTQLDIAGVTYKTLQDIPAGHKMALKHISQGENIIKYGFPIGVATADIKPGEHIHTQNVKTGLSGTLTYQYNPKPTQLPKGNDTRTFKGYVRKNGDVGIRNELWIVPTVGCVNGQAEQIIRRFKDEVNPVGIDAIEVFKHSYGCSQLGDDHKNTRKILGDIVLHPNAGGVLVLGLGCENNIVGDFRKSLGEYDDERVKYLVAQEVQDEIEEGVTVLKELYAKMQEDKRVDVPLSKLRIGLKCGGSDGFSGITANPLLGAFSDFLISNGGTTILTEVPEMFGAETILMERTVNREVFDKTVHLINDFKDYFMAHNQPVYENPSPGNKAGGISTLEDKSLGCTQKGGTAPVVDVLKYGERLKTNGLNLLSAPGNDLVATTALGASGCQMVLFTTGRGTPFGSFIPTMKISTNSRIAGLKPHWIDFNAGVLLEDKTMDMVLNDFVNKILSVASGEKLNHESQGFKEISIFKTGVTL
jgi:altronate hydrolase